MCLTLFVVQETIADFDVLILLASTFSKIICIAFSPLTNTNIIQFTTFQTLPGDMSARFVVRGTAYDLNNWNKFRRLRLASTEEFTTVDILVCDIFFKAPSTLY